MDLKTVDCHFSAESASVASWDWVPSVLWTKVALFACDSARAAFSLSLVCRLWKTKVFPSKLTPEAELQNAVYALWKSLCHLRWSFPFAAKEGDWFWYYQDTVSKEIDLRSCESFANVTDSGATNSYAYEFHQGEFLISDHMLWLHEAEVPAWDSPNLTGLSVWNCGVVGAKFFEYKETLSPNWCAGKSVIELGCGTGILGLALALTNPFYHVLCTDMSDVLQLTQINIDANRSFLQCSNQATCLHNTCAGVRVQTSSLQWESFVSLNDGLRDKQEHFDIVILADVVWYIEGVLPLVSALHALTNEHSTVMLFFQSRHVDVDLVFWDLVRRRFDIRRLPVACLHPKFRNSLVSVYELTRISDNLAIVLS